MTNANGQRPAASPRAQTGNSGALARAEHSKWAARTLRARAACRRWMTTHRMLVGSLLSALLHAIALVVLGLSLIHLPTKDRPTTLLARVERAVPVDLETVKVVEQHIDPAVTPTTIVSVTATSMAEARIDAPKITSQNKATVDSPQPANSGDAAGQTLPGAPGGLGGLRSVGGRKAAVDARGGTAASEAAVDRALDWIARHQQLDGGWSFDHRTKNCKGDCDEVGMLATSRVAATSMAVLPFLGAGHTHRSGPYKKQLSAGLKFLERTLERNGNAMDASGGMYAHALATLALCEAYAMTDDRLMMRPAGRALQYIVSSQDQIGGGWRYTPGQPGDTSAVGWQVMALKSGHLAYLRIPPETIVGASRFLDSVQFDAGAAYGYLPGYTETRPSTTAIGLLCRMLMGWTRDDAGLAAGVKTLAIAGPSSDDYYYNYYATQVMHNFDGPLWAQWNSRMRDQLIAAQVKNGHSAGSWFVNGGHNDHNRLGGRLYCTSLAAMTLEVYYRYLPVYQAGKREEKPANNEKSK